MTSDPARTHSGFNRFTGEIPLEISRSADDTIGVRFRAGSTEELEVAAADVTRWCTETSVLLRATFELAEGDEVRVRTPMLAGRRGSGALVVVRQITSEGSRFVVATAATTAELAAERFSSTIDVTLDEVRSLLMALESAAQAAMPPQAGL